MFDDLSAGGCVLLILLFIGLVLLGTWVLTFLWNFVMPELFGLPPITFWQMLALSALTNALTGGSSVASRSRD
jgi:hypothetical protein